jgi:hypothetical protein
MKSEFFLTEVRQDWTEHNLVALQSAIIEAERATLARSDIEQDPLLVTPNLPNYRGVLRWVMVQKQLELAVLRGRFEGITASWVDLAGAHVLELRAHHTIVTPCHLLDPDDVPRETKYRKSRRVVNQVCPLLTGFEGLEGGSLPDEELIQILLVHGGKKSTFAYLRAYIDPDDPAIYRQLSMNIMLMPVLLPSIDVEPVAEPVINLKTAVTEQDIHEVG